MAEFLLALLLFGTVISLIGLAKDNIKSSRQRKQFYRPITEPEESRKVRSVPLAKAEKQAKAIKDAKANTNSMPKGRFLPWSVSVQDPVKGGFLTEEEWEEFSSHYDKKKLKPETRKRVNAWHEKKLEAYDYNEKNTKTWQRFVRTSKIQSNSATRT